MTEAVATDAIEAGRMIRDAGIHLSATNILGVPTGTLEDDLSTMKLNSDSRISYAHAFLFQPYPGTELGQYAEQNGFMDGTYDDIGEIAWDSSIMIFQSEDGSYYGSGYGPGGQDPAHLVIGSVSDLQSVLNFGGVPR